MYQTPLPSHMYVARDANSSVLVVDVVPEGTKTSLVEVSIHVNTTTHHPDVDTV